MTTSPFQPQPFYDSVNPEATPSKYGTMQVFLKPSTLFIWMLKEYGNVPSVGQNTVGKILPLIIAVHGERNLPFQLNPSLDLHWHKCNCEENKVLLFTVSVSDCMMDEVLGIPCSLSAVKLTELPCADLGASRS